MVRALGCPSIVGTHFRPHLQTTPTAGGWARGSVRRWVCGRGSSQYTGDGNRAGDELESDVCHCPRWDGASLIRAAVQSHTALPPLTEAALQNHSIKREKKGFPCGLGSHSGV